MPEHVSLSVPSPPLVAPATRSHARVRQALAREQRTLTQALGLMTDRVDELTRVADRLVATLRAGNKLLVAGNGGSAAEAQHFAAELVGRFRRERRPYAALALTTDSAILTALANDYGYAQVFARQVEALGRPGDLLLAFSTSGESENLIAAAHVARQAGIAVVAVTGQRPSRLATLATLALRVPTADTACVQALHLIVTHLLCDLVESALALDDEGICHVDDASRPLLGP